jgi:hypothetical protein
VDAHHQDQARGLPQQPAAHLDRAIDPLQNTAKINARCSGLYHADVQVYEAQLRELWQMKIARPASP